MTTTHPLKTCQLLAIADHETAHRIPVMDEEDATRETHHQIIRLLQVLDAQLIAIDAPTWHRTICRDLVARIGTLLS